MTPPTPQVLERILDDIRVLLAPIEDAYKWYYPAAHARGGRTDLGSRYQLGRITRPTEDAATAGGRDAARRKLDTAGRSLSDALKSVKGAQKALAEAATILDEGADHLPSEHDHRFPRVATRAEVAQAERAQQRRRARGEDYGVG